MKLSVYQVQMMLIIFLSLYTILGLTGLIVWWRASVTFNSANSNNYPDLNENSSILVNTIDLSLHTHYWLFKYFSILGVFMLLYAPLGAGSVWFEHQTCLKACGFVLLIIASMKIPVIAFTLFVTSLDTVTYAKSDILTNFQASAKNDIAANARNFMQLWHGCCGVMDYTDYSTYNVKKNNAYPKSCCYDNTHECYSDDEVIQTGCATKISDYYGTCYNTIGGLSLFILILEVPAILLTFHLPRLLKEIKGRHKAAAVFKMPNAITLL